MNETRITLQTALIENCISQEIYFIYNKNGMRHNWYSQKQHTIPNKWTN